MARGRKKKSTSHESKPPREVEYEHLVPLKVPRRRRKIDRKYFRCMPPDYDLVTYRRRHNLMGMPFDDPAHPLK